MADVFDPCGKIWKVLPQVLAQYYQRGQYHDMPPFVPIGYYCHHVVVLGWAGLSGFVKIAMVRLFNSKIWTFANYQKIVASIPPSPYANTTDFYIISGTSHGKPRSYDNKVKLRRNPQWEGLVLDCYIRMDSICIVPLSILFWWTEIEHRLSGHQLMLQRESMMKLHGYLEMQERVSSAVMASIEPHLAALPSIVGESEGMEGAVETEVTRPELAEDTERAGHNQYLGYIMEPSGTPCAYPTLVTPSPEPLEGSGLTNLDS